MLFERLFSNIQSSCQVVSNSDYPRLSGRILVCVILLAVLTISLDWVSGLKLSTSALGQIIEPSKGTWKTVAPAPTKRTEVAVASAGGKIYVIGGFIAQSFFERVLSRISKAKKLVMTDLVEEYDPSNDRWTIKAPLPEKINHAGAGAVENQLFVIGGYGKSGASSRVFRYEAKSDTWITQTSMPTPRGALAVAEFDGKLFAIGGKNKDGNSSAVEVYNSITDTWESKTPFPTPRDHLAAVSDKQWIYAIGGRLRGDFRHNLATVEAYDPNLDSWKQVADLPTARSGIAAGVVNGRIYVVGGESQEGTFRRNDAYLPKENRWISMAPLPTARHGLGAVSINERLYVLSGGPTPGASYSNVNEVFIAPH